MGFSTAVVVLSVPPLLFVLHEITGEKNNNKNSIYTRTQNSALQSCVEHHQRFVHCCVKITLS